MNAEPPTARFHVEHRPRRPGYRHRWAEKLMNIMPVLELEDDEGNPAELNAPAVCGTSFFSMRNLISEMSAVTTYILEHCREDRGEFSLFGGYCFDVPAYGVFEATKTLRVHFKWDWAFRKIRTSPVLSWEDFGGGGFEYKLIRQNGQIEVRHSRRGHWFTAQEEEFLAAADAAIADMKSFKGLLGHSCAAIGLSDAEMADLNTQLWEPPD